MIKMKFRKLLLIFPLLFLFGTFKVSAHCPLCTIGAMAVAGGATWLGVSSAVVGLFIGAFAASLGLWIARAVKKKKEYIRFQSPLIFLGIYLSTVLPLLPLIEGIHPVYISWFGEYGSLLNRTYLLNIFLIGSLIGGFVMGIMPWVSGKVTAVRNGRMLFPYQGIVLTLALLVVIGSIMQFLI